MFCLHMLFKSVLPTVHFATFMTFPWVPYVVNFYLMVAKAIRSAKTFATQVTNMYILFGLISTLTTWRRWRGTCSLMFGHSSFPPPCYWSGSVLLGTTYWLLILLFVIAGVTWDAEEGDGRNR